MSAVSRQYIIQRYKDFREGAISNFRSYGQTVKDKLEFELFWSKQMEDKMRKGSDDKREMAQMQEGKKLGLLEDLKEVGSR